MMEMRFVVNRTLINTETGIFSCRERSVIRVERFGSDTR